MIVQQKILNLNLLDSEKSYKNVMNIENAYKTRGINFNNVDVASVIISFS